MAESDYARLLPGGVQFSALVPKKSGRGGKRAGAGRPKGSGSTRSPKPAKVCACGSQVARGRSAYCEPCAQRRIAQNDRRCDHPKPMMASGRERKVCYDCAPRPEPKPRKAYQPKVVRTATCAAPGCAQPFTQKTPSARFCADRCRLKVHARAVQEKRRNSDPRPCRWCDAVFVPEYGSFRIAYCTVECRAKAKRKVRSGSTHRRRAAKFGCDYEPVSKREVFERDGWRCYLCGRDTPKELSGTKEPNAPELDHVVPLAHGGPHAYANVKCSCRECNRRKGAKVPAQP